MRPVGEAVGFPRDDNVVPYRKNYQMKRAVVLLSGGIDSATPQQINPGGTSYVLVAYRGSIAQLAAALSGRGWAVETSGSVVKIRSASGKPPPLPPPPQAVPPQPQRPAPQPQPQSAPGRQE